MRKEHKPGELINKMHKKHKKMSPLTGLKEGSPKDMALDKSLAMHLKHKKHPHHMAKHLAHHMEKMAKHMHKLHKHMMKHAK